MFQNNTLNSILIIRKNFFIRRVINHWNHLPKEVISATSTDDFKNLIDFCMASNMYILISYSCILGPIEQVEQSVRPYNCTCIKSK